MKMFVVGFRGSLVVQADSEEDAYKKADEWVRLLEEKTAKDLLPDVTAVMLHRLKGEDAVKKKVRKAALLAVAALAASADAEKAETEKKNGKRKKQRQQ